ncbi:O-antigen ligase family protein [Paenibacillus sp. TAB 01]|uniref:O-antigen ligase family protein n=1 Tax=Paenibacillus sp. TAB 01 TaxID=3368988 RepID=UPI0037519247
MYKKNLVKEEKTSLLYWLLTCFVVLFLFWAPFQKGLFNGFTADFERPIYSATLWGFIALIAASIYFFYNWKLKDHRDILSIVVWLLPLTYLLSKLNEASRYYATNMVYIQMLYAIFFILGIYLCKSAIGNRILTYSIMASGYVVVWFGLINWVGYKQFAGNLVKWFVDLGDPSGYRDAVMSASNELRLTATFQYANSYAALLIALLFGAAYLLVNSRKAAAIAVNGFMLVPIIVSFFLTLSRGAIVLLPVVLLLILPFMKLTKQIFMLLYLVIASVISVLILSKITAIGEQFYLHQSLAQASTGIWILLGASLGCALLLWLFQKFVYPTVERIVESKIRIKYANILLPAVALVVGGLGVLLLFGNIGVTNLLPDYIKQRIESINFNTHSVIERGLFYKDAVKLFEDYPLLGAGGGAWAALYEKYQSYSYTSRQAHNFFMQYLVETGIVGIVVLIGFLLYNFILYIRNCIKNSEKELDRHVFFVIALSLLIHSTIDFDLSFVFLGILVFLCLGAMVSNISLSGPKFIKEGSLPYINKSYPAALLLLSVIMFFLSAQSLNANSLFQSARAAASGQKSVNEIFTPLNKALSIKENHPDYLAFENSILLQGYQQTKNEQFFTQLMNQINQSKADEPHNRYLVDQEIQAYLLKNQLSQALNVVKTQIDNYPWDIDMYEKRINFDFALAEQARINKDQSLMKQYWDDAYAVHNMVLSKVEELGKLPKELVIVKPFNVTNTMALDLSKMEFISGKYASTENYLKPFISDQFDDETNQEIARWYLAALQKQNKNDQVLYDKLISKEPNERDEINKLVSATF